MSTPSTEGTSADHSRSGEDIAEAIEVAERGSAVEEVHDQGTEATSGTAPVEQAAGDPDMTEGQVVYGSGGDDDERGAGHLAGADRAEFGCGAVRRRRAALGPGGRG